MNEKLTRLFNTLCEIETKGRSTVVMGDCLKYLEQLIKECSDTKTQETE